MILVQIQTAGFGRHRQHFFYKGSMDAGIATAIITGKGSGKVKVKIIVVGNGNHLLASKTIATKIKVK